jgi:hypothetical protein
VASGLVFGSKSSLLWFIQQTPVTARAAPKNYVKRYVGLRRSGSRYRHGARSFRSRQFPSPQVMRLFNFKGAVVTSLS